MKYRSAHWRNHPTEFKTGHLGAFFLNPHVTSPSYDRVTWCDITSSGWSVVIIDVIDLDHANASTNSKIVPPFCVDLLFVFVLRAVNSCRQHARALFIAAHHCYGEYKWASLLFECWALSAEWWPHAVCSGRVRDVSRLADRVAWSRSMMSVVVIRRRP